MTNEKEIDEPNTDREFAAEKEEKADEGPEWEQENDDGSTTILLQHPVPYKNKDKEPLSEVTLKIPLVGDVEAGDAAKGDVGKTVLMVASLSGEPKAMIRRIHMTDFNRINTCLVKYLGGDDDAKKSQETGGA